MEWFQAIILGLVQGLTEFLPVSSSGHLAIGREILGVEESGDLVFEVAVHAATVLATIVVFRKQIWRLLCGLLKFRYNDETDYICKILVSMVPVFLVGVLLKDQVKELFSSLAVVGGALILTSSLLFLSDFKKPAAGDVPDPAAGGSGAASEGPSPAGDGSKPAASSRNGISFRQALIIGVGQAFAVIPGLSRSGATISTGLLCGVRREDVAGFSFLMVLIPILGEAFLDLVGGDVSASTVGTLPLLLGFLSAFASGLFACKAMIALVKKARLKWFALYCSVVGFAVILYSMFA